MPAVDTPADCTPWVIGGLWPVELETVTPATAMMAEYLKTDLQRIANSANEKLRTLRHAGRPESVRRAEEARIINVARAFAVLRVESTVRQLRKDSLGLSAKYLSVTAAPETAIALNDTPPIVLDEAAEPETSDAEHSEAGGQIVLEPEPDEERLRRLLDFVARQEPGLRWAVGDQADGTTLLVTDLAHGWIPAGITLPAGVELLLPASRVGRVGELLGDVELWAVYHPGDPFGPAASYEVTVASSKCRQLPPVDDLGWNLGEATHGQDGLPRLVNTLAKAGAAGTGVVDAELDVLRVHSETARYQLLAQYPDVDGALLRNYLLLAATEAIATGDEISANYHFAWFEALSAPEVSQ